MTDDFTDTVVEMYRGRKKKPYYELSKRELEILQLVVKGYTSKKMAAHLGLSPRTIDHHRSNILKKMGKKNSVDLVNFVVRNGFITP